MKNKVLPILKILVIILLNLFAITLFWVSTNTSEDVSVLSKVGSRGTEVRAIQEKLKEQKINSARNLLDVLDDETIADKTGLDINFIKSLRM